VTNPQRIGDLMEDAYVEDEIVQNVTDCPGCNEVCGHEILREKKVNTGSDFLVKCIECGKVHTVQFRTPKAVSIQFLLSEGANTVVNHIDLDEDELLTIGDIFEHAEASWEINRIENKKSEPKKSLVATEIGRINALRSDVVMVRLTLTEGEYSNSDSIFVERDTIFKSGSIFEHKGTRWRIRAIHTGAGRTMTGSVAAHDIRRIYLHEPPRVEEFIPRTPRERRQAWKEGKLGHNPNPIIPDAEKSGKAKQQRQGRRKKKERR
jgi:uncharacterized Zn finger protein